MTTDPTNHRAEAAALFARAKALLDAQPDDVYEDPAELAAVGILGALLAIDDDLDGEEQHQSEKFDATAVVYNTGTRATWVAPPVAESDEGNPDTLNDDTVETRYGLGYIDDNRLGYPPAEEPDDRVTVPGIGRTDFYGKPGPWDAA